MNDGLPPLLGVLGVTQPAAHKDNIRHGWWNYAADYDAPTPLHRGTATRNIHPTLSSFFMSLCLQSPPSSLSVCNQSAPWSPHPTPVSRKPSHEARETVAPHPYRPAVMRYSSNEKQIPGWGRPIGES